MPLLADPGVIMPFRFYARRCTSQTFILCCNIFRFTGECL